MHGLCTLTLGGILVGADITSDAWARFYSAFGAQIGGDPSGVTFLTTTRSFGANEPSTGAFEQYDLCNQAPSWGPAYRPAGFAIYDAYKDLVDSLDYEANQAALNKIQAQLTLVNNANALWNQCIKGLTAQWLSFSQSQSSLPPADQTPYQDWYTTYGAPSCDPTKTAWQTQVAQYNLLVQSAAQSGYEYVVDAVNDLTQSAGYTSVFNGQDTLNVSLCRFTPDPLTTITNWQTGQGSQGSFTVSASTSTDTDWQFSTESGAELFVEPVTFAGAGSYSHVGVDTSSASFEMTVSWQGMQTFSMERGVWYDGEVLNHKNGPFTAGSPIANGEVKLWGPNGTLGLVPMQAIVYYQPTVSISLDESTYQQVKSSWSAETATCIFIFCFESEADGSSSQITFNDEKFNIVITDTTNIPKLVAVVNAVNQGSDSVVQGSLASLQLDVSKMQASDNRGVTFHVLPHSIAFEGKGGSFTGTVLVSSTQATCNNAGNYPTLSASKLQCVMGQGLKQFTTPAGLVFLYVNSNTQDLAHLTLGTVGNLGVGAHLTCRPFYPDANGRHTPLNKGIVSWFKGGCCTGNGWPSNVESDMQRIINSVYKCL